MLLLFSLLACTPEVVDTQPLEASALLPWPSLHALAEDEATPTGWRLSLDAAELPVPDGGTPVPVERLERLDGVSVASTGVALLGVEVDSSLLPGFCDGLSTLEPGSPVQLLDLDAGERVPVMAELDAHPQADSVAERVLLLRPLRAMVPGAHHAFVITTALTGPYGEPLSPTTRFTELEDDPHQVELLSTLEGLDLPASSLVEAWDFWTASSELTHAPLQRVLAASREALPANPDMEPVYTVDWVEERGQEGVDLGEHGWRLASGTLDLPSFLEDDVGFEVDAEGLPVLQGTAPVDWMAWLPRSLEEAPAGSAPVLILGHGILREPGDYLDDPEDPALVQALADRLGAVVIGTSWRGLCTDDLAAALGVGMDFGLIDQLTDGMTQGLGNASALTRLPRTGFARTPFLQAAGGGSLVDPERVYYFGISLGGIQGATLLATAEPQELQYGVFHVGGSTWSTMLERSSNWPPFEGLLENTVRSPVDRQLLYAVSQLYWDPVDPITHTLALSQRSVLWQETMGDDQVPNLTTESLARSAGVPVLAPAVEPPSGMDPAEAPLGPGAAALMQLDPGLGRPEEINRPAEVTGAHHGPRHTEEFLLQVEAFFTEGQEGTIVHPCAPDPCVFDQDESP